MGDSETSIQPPMAGLQNMLLPTSFPSSLTLDARSNLFDQALSSSRSEALSAAEPMSSSLMPSLTAPPSAAAAARLPLVGPSLEQQIMALQRQNQPISGSLLRRRGQQSVQESSYPNSWFRVNSGEFLAQALMNDVSASSAQIPSRTLGSTLPNQVFARSNQLGQEQLNRGTSSMSAMPALNYGGYSGDDNPFEPVPIAEDISQQNISRRHPENKDSEP